MRYNPSGTFCRLTRLGNLTAIRLVPSRQPTASRFLQQFGFRQLDASIAKLAQGLCRSRRLAGVEQGLGIGETPLGQSLSELSSWLVCCPNLLRLLQVAPSARQIIVLHMSIAPLHITFG